MIDLHTHILPGIDDGPDTLDEAVAMARSAAADGIRVVAATPHVRSDYPTRPESMEAALAEVRAAVAAQGIPLELRGGGEVALEMVDALGRDGLARFGLGGSASYVLLEFPYAGWPLALPALVLDLRARGITPVIAHPERNAEVQADPDRLRPVVLSGALVQLTAASVDGRLGRRSRAAGLELLDRGLAHVLASDAHTPDIRAIGMSAAAEAVGDPSLAAWLTEDVPAAVLAGRDRPPRPPERRRRRRLFAV